MENFIFCAVFLKFGQSHILRNFDISSEILETYFTPGHFFAKGLNLPYLSKQKGWSDGAGGPVKS